MSMILFCTCTKIVVLQSVKKHLVSELFSLCVVLHRWELLVQCNNLLNVGKLLFSISRSENNYKLFVEEQMIQPIVKLLAIVDISDALVYLMGAVKLLAGNVALRSEVTSCGIMNCLTFVLGKIAEVGIVHVYIVIV